MADSGSFSGGSRLAPPSRYDEDNLLLEEETLKKEFKWLLEVEFETTLDAIKKCLTECARKLSVVLDPHSKKDSHKILLRHPQQGEPVLCVASVDGDKISKADVTLRQAGRLGTHKPLRTSIKEHAAWKLRQIQNSANQFLLAQQKLSFIIQNRESLSTPLALCQALVELASNLQEAERVLVVPQLPSVSEIHSAELRSHFKPELPEDTVVRFHIHADNLVLTIFNVSPVGKPSTNVDHTLCDGYTFEHSAGFYEVTNMIQVQSVVPWLSSVLRWFQEAQELTQDFIDKIEIFKSIHY
ncbi:PREDICTED: protein rogdi homolog [Amphimedon queenslandica]|uniref:Protein rogdi homolog n=1 Tax=Amphimedon queenslandica TaxID=400682 RepID=A0A1X7UM10_AMPQE|nr:PREDICTED: protein rogdi homolog [Amphimedon queenslandica]|eukprot:XP_003387392.1 PREDICTED: protein rogdi homolog [Amphimedon queenslandica]